ncbi:TetR/AcrR family transcriptional regulator [Parasulfuritortus cantonensis]|uniref:TetR/AcrR family transcriptional regulator n=1 Tax=Parasulfuritortus cantonensis TaxID=2528202 RepID=A0A4R1B5H4_9PROT|nr:TetR/AcrR family transcriptional regulator [Parasulfuritortus cantonensis]TCJ12750.1 TetR/AcrR family transcriptional regulator [Parasulfuritortus cantonensis]
MKTKSEAKRQAILAVAAETFGELGFERASMSEICARVGGSKATLYNHFASKEELFLTVMFQASEHEFEAVHRLLDPDIGDVAGALRDFGRGFLAVLYSPQVTAARRLVIAEAHRSELGRACYALGPGKGDAALAGFLETAMQAGKLRPAEPRIAASHLRGLLEAELLERFLFGVLTDIGAEALGPMVERAVEVFMRAYGPT